MNLYLIEQNENNGYDTYDSAVVSAENENEAKGINPSGCKFADDYSGIWASKPENVKATLLGKADKSIKERKVICSSFNAG